MKCKNCGHENEAGLKYCTNCGQPLEMISEDVLLDLALAYTGIPSVAQEIIKQSKPTIQDIRKQSILWIQEQNQDLFQDKITPIEGPTLDTITDISQDLKDLDYEERIVVLMHCVEKLSIEQISQELSLPTNQIQFYLQQSYQKCHPQGNQPLPSKPKQPIKAKTKKKEAIVQPKFLSHITWKTQVTIALIIAIGLGSFLGIKSYASNEYENGVKLYENGDYEQAVDPLLNAKRYGGSNDAGLMLAKTYYSLEQYDNALKELEQCEDSDEEVNKYLVLTYTQLANIEVASKNYGEALTYLEKQYEIDKDEVTNRRIQACQNNGTYETQEGNYNAYGNPTKLYALDGDKRIYQVDFDYDEDQKLSGMQEYVSSGTKKVVFNSFENVQETDITWSYLNEKPGYYEVVSNLLNEENQVLVSTISNPNQTSKISYTYTYDADNQIKEVTVEGKETTTDTYEYNGQLLTDIIHEDGTVTSYKYNRKNQLTSKREINQDGSTTLETTYTYKDKQLDTKQVDDITYEYTYTNKQPNTCIIQKEGKEIGRGYYVRNQGWIYLYIE